MDISATIKNSLNTNTVTVSTDNNKKELTIAGKTTGYGSSINGGELLFLSLATCFCNDIYREAAKRKMEVNSVEVTVSGEFGKEGEPAANITYQATVDAPTSTHHEVSELIKYVDQVAEVHNTLRKGVHVTLGN
jgi:uncharacterized OsmC-like protein